MLDNTFNIERFRFHLSKPNTLVITGWFWEQGHQCGELAVYLDERKLAVSADAKTGIEIKQRYAGRKMGIEEEINLQIALPEHFETYKKLYIYCNHTGDNSGNPCSAIKISQLVALKENIDYYIEELYVVDQKLKISGWAVGSDPVEISLAGKHGVLACQLERGYRQDVSAAYPEGGTEKPYGFKIELHCPAQRVLWLQLQSGGKKTNIRINAKKSGILSEKARLLVKGSRYLKNYGFAQFWQKVRVQLLKKDAIDYNKWRLRHIPTKEELRAQRSCQFDVTPKFSIVVPLYQTPLPCLCQMIDSFLDQTYENWELCMADGTGRDSRLKEVLEHYAGRDQRIRFTILDENAGISGNTNAAMKMATGDFIVLADHDDIVPPDALYECAKALNEDRDIDVIYTDEDKVDMKGKKFFSPLFKPDFNIDLLCSMNYICHLFVVRREVAGRVGMLRTEYDGSQDYDFILRCVEVAEKIHHIPKVLYHWRCHMDSTAARQDNKEYAFEAGRQAIEAHYQRMGIPARVSHGVFHGIYKTTYFWEEEPLVSILIPNKDHVDELRNCIQSIEEKSQYKNIEYIIIENNSVQEETFAFYKQLEQKNQKLRVVSYQGSFNFSKINNFGAQFARGDYLLLLNNDTEMIHGDGISQMLGYCMREDVGVVGARLYYGDGAVQHAGVVIGYGGIAGHAFVNASGNDIGYASRIICAQDYSAVTAACMMTKREVYEAVHGMREELEVALNDIDYCLKVRQLGKLVVYNPHAEFYHYESKSRGLEDTPQKLERFHREIRLFGQYWNTILEEGDPYYNPNLTLDRADFSLKP